MELLERVLTVAIAFMGFLALVCVAAVAMVRFTGWIDRMTSPEEDR